MFILYSELIITNESKCNVQVPKFNFQLRFYEKLYKSLNDFIGEIRSHNERHMQSQSPAVCVLLIIIGNQEFQ